MRNKTCYRTLCFVMFLILCASYGAGQTRIDQRLESNKCGYWQSQVGYDVRTPKHRTTTNSKIDLDTLQLVSDLKDISEKDALKGINCLLKLEGNKQYSIRGATSVYSSQVFGPSSVEVAALYYISAIYYEKWDHALAAQIVVNNGLAGGDSETIHKAYKAYRAWFKKVQKIGMVKAREERLDPLQGTGISWYGNAPKP